MELLQSCAKPSIWLYQNSVLLECHIIIFPWGLKLKQPLKVSSYNKRELWGQWNCLKLIFNVAITERFINHLHLFSTIMSLLQDDDNAKLLSSQKWYIGLSAALTAQCVTVLPLKAAYPTITMGNYIHIIYICIYLFFFCCTNSVNKVTLFRIDHVSRTSWASAVFSVWIW